MKKTGQAISPWGYYAKEKLLCTASESEPFLMYNAPVWEDAVAALRCVGR